MAGALRRAMETLPIAVGLVGPGAVGRALLEQLRVEVSLREYPAGPRYVPAGWAGGNGPPALLLPLLDWPPARLAGWGGRQLKWQSHKCCCHPLRCGKDAVSHSCITAAGPAAARARPAARRLPHLCFEISCALGGPRLSTPRLSACLPPQTPNLREKYGIDLQVQGILNSQQVRLVI